ncbi:hypothetical protein [Xenorhabdus sp. BG5]|nr:hypothetical protein [Xenorhabdus sp. BG5]
MQKILTHWGGWVVQDRVNIGWKSVCKHAQFSIKCPR